ncbi:hypothetical protein M9H77_34009 [Catharanthus roseus]|uniref:Uncharacterized protein n=1 Tax=Catharanthus roseus TaxID=4058 RepID=A0ACB9ZK45_CATRO|nr:hypothetical protein M9H77_34009 [Catharanthus roseus]
MAPFSLETATAAGIFLLLRVAAACLQFLLQLLPPHNFSCCSLCSCAASIFSCLLQSRLPQAALGFFSRVAVDTAIYPSCSSVPCNCVRPSVNGLSSSCFLELRFAGACCSAKENAISRSAAVTCSSSHHSSASASDWSPTAAAAVRCVLGPPLRVTDELKAGRDFV